MIYYTSTTGTNASAMSTIAENIRNANSLSSTTFSASGNVFYLGSSPTSINFNPNNPSSYTIDLNGYQGSIIVQGAAATIRLAETNAAGATVETGLATSQESIQPV